MTIREVTERVRREVRRLARRASVWGRRAGVLPYEPERWTTDQWTDAYRAGTLDYYGRLDELARYSVIVGYVGWFATTCRRPPSVLDIGCGVGLLRSRLESVPFSHYVGVDLSETAIHAANARAHTRSRFVAGDFSSLDLGRFDVVVLNEVLYYAADAAAFLDRVGSALESEGILLVSMWRHPGDRSLWRALDSAFALVDRVEVRNRFNPINKRGWLVGCSRAGAGPAPGSSPQSGIS
jgi:2-polyprenyl-6-hydroxyphenyl methylase/3-demethylubiquinone-9 3-methyltransferase